MELENLSFFLSFFFFLLRWKNLKGGLTPEHFSAPYQPPVADFGCQEPYFFFFFFLIQICINFYWSIFTLQCCVSFCCKQNESSTCIHKYPFFGFPSHIGHQRALSSVPCAIEQTLTVCVCAQLLPSQARVMVMVVMIMMCDDYYRP